MRVRAHEIKVGDRIPRISKIGAAFSMTVAGIRTVQEGSVLRYGFIVAPHGDFLGWFSAGGMFTIERD